MGWVCEEDGEHEGWVVAYIEREGCGGLYRELSYPQDSERRHSDIVRLGAGCACGWRSAHWAPTGPAIWHPYSAAVTPGDEESALAAWRKHTQSL